MSLLPVAEAQARLFALAEPLSAETVPIGEAVGRWLAQDLIALRDQPWADLSAMDGYAVRAAEHPGPWRVTGESTAGGATPAPISAGAALRIFTGAPVPPGADAILIQENATRDGDLLMASADPLPVGRHIRARASDFARETLLLDSGARLGAAQVALAVLGGHGRVAVHRRPRVALLSTGNELVPPGADTPPGMLPSSNAPMLAALLADLPCDVIDLGIVSDDLDAMTAAFARATQADIIVSTGGASVGDHDLVRPAFAAAGGALDFWKIRMRPGKPLMAGTLGKSLFLGLPGNPVSAMVCGTVFVVPVLRKMLGLPAAPAARVDLPLGVDLPANGPREHYMRAMVRDGAVLPEDNQDSSLLGILSRADVLMVRPPHDGPRAAGEIIGCIPL
ncbi:molybdopterin molybdotransferase MoeA [Sulfitobacter sp. UBA4523]|uniref:molybdopterin molybdotransferase MoeA n=1 Tax=Sulfitobacter sp. UBA4523 TaxID=1947584 RepID=UPI002579ECFF|nr:molybdopterin molybdotransferase MoeA [Sulfitobacter sp. UBA4523]